MWFYSKTFLRLLLSLEWLSRGGCETFSQEITSDRLFKNELFIHILYFKEMLIKHLLYAQQPARCYEGGMKKMNGA